MLVGLISSTKISHAMTFGVHVEHYRSPKAKMQSRRIEICSKPEATAAFDSSSHVLFDTCGGGSSAPGNLFLVLSTSRAYSKISRLLSYRIL